jgi:protein-disulfide isomerase
MTPQPSHLFFDRGVIDFENQITFGDPQAPQKIVFYTAPFCAPCSDLLERAISLPWQNQKQVQLVVKYAVSDPDQVLPSSAVFAAHEQAAHREMIEFLQQNPSTSHREIIAFIDELNLDQARFEKMLVSPATKQHLARNRAEGAYFELESVPFIIIGQHGFLSLSPDDFEEKIKELMDPPAS